MTDMIRSQNLSSGLLRHCFFPPVRKRAPLLCCLVFVFRDSSNFQYRRQYIPHEVGRGDWNVQLWVKRITHSVGLGVTIQQQTSTPKALSSYRAAPLPRCGIPSSRLRGRSSKPTRTPVSPPAVLKHHVVVG